jgi:hypothetical protein
VANAEPEIQSPSDTLNKLSQALVLIARGDPLVALRNELQTKFDGIRTQFESIEKATDLQHQDQVRIPTQIDKAILSLRELLEEKIDGLHDALTDVKEYSRHRPEDIGTEIAHLDELITQKIATAVAILDGKVERHMGETAEKFAGTEKQFTERDKRGEQLSLADKTGVTTALAAQEKQAIAQQESNTASNAKTENNFTKLIDEIRRNNDEMRRNTDVQINDLKSRMDKGEGRSGISDPATSEALRVLTVAVGHLSAANNQGEGGARAKADYTATIFGVAGLLAAVIVIIGGLFAFSGSKGSAPAPIIIERSATGDKVVQ